MNYKYINNPHSRNKFLEIIETFSYVDSFRGLHEDLRKYTWGGGYPLKKSRLDFFISESFLSSLESCSIESSYRPGLRATNAEIFSNLRLFITNILPQTQSYL